MGGIAGIRFLTKGWLSGGRGGGEGRRKKKKRGAGPTAISYLESPVPRPEMRGGKKKKKYNASFRRQGIEDLKAGKGGGKRKGRKKRKKVPAPVSLNRIIGTAPEYKKGKGKEKKAMGPGGGRGGEKGKKRERKHRASCSTPLSRYAPEGRREKEKKKRDSSRGPGTPISSRRTISGERERKKKKKKGPSTGRLPRLMPFQENLQRPRQTVRREGGKEKEEKHETPP